MHWFLSFFSVSRLASSFCSWCQLVELFLLNTEVKHQVYVKRPTQIRTTWPTFLFTSRLLFYAQISSFAQFFIHKNCFWALLSTLFLFWEIFNSNRTFAVRRIECFHMTSRPPYWCPKTMKRRPCWCPTPILWELHSFLMQTLSFVPINLHRCWPREWKHSIREA